MSLDKPNWVIMWDNNGSIGVAAFAHLEPMLDKLAKVYILTPKVYSFERREYMDVELLADQYRDCRRR